MRKMMKMHLELMTSIATRQKLISVNILLFLRPKYIFFPNPIKISDLKFADEQIYRAFHNVLHDYKHL